MTKEATNDSMTRANLQLAELCKHCRGNPHIIFEIRISSFLRASSFRHSAFGPLQIFNRDNRLRITQRCSYASARPEASFDKFHFHWNVEVTFVVRLLEKSPDSGATNFAIIASKFVHIHTDEFPGQLRVHVARIGK